MLPFKVEPSPQCTKPTYLNVELYRTLKFERKTLGSSPIYDIPAQHNRRRSKSVLAKIGSEKNKLTLMYSALIIKSSYAKLKVLRLMVTCYIGNMIAFLRCHYAYLSITITSKLSALNHNKILYYCNCHATISSSVHTFASFFSQTVKINYVTINKATTCDASLQGTVQCRVCENATLLAIKQLRKITFY